MKACTNLKTNDARLLERVLRQLQDGERVTDGAVASALASAQRLAGEIELAYGLLWLAVDCEAPRPMPEATRQECHGLARGGLLQCLDRAGQKRGIDAAKLLINRR